MKAKTQPIRPLKDWIQIRPANDEKVGNLYVVPGKQTRYDRGVVVAVGEGKRAPRTGVLIAPCVKPGETILFQHLGPQVQTPLLNGDILIQENEIYCVLEEAENVQ